MYTYTPGAWERKGTSELKKMSASRGAPEGFPARRPPGCVRRIYHKGGLAQKARLAFVSRCSTFLAKSKQCLKANVS